MFFSSEVPSVCHS